MEYIYIVIAALLFAVSVSIVRAIRSVPFAELKRRARNGHETPVYRLAARGRKTEWFLIVLNVLVSSYAITKVSGWWQIAVLLAILAWLSVGRQDLLHYGFGQRLVGLVANWLAKLFDSLPGMHPHTQQQNPHTHLFDKEDLLELLERQSKQTDSRINEAELATAIRALNFSNLQVGDVMVPLAKSKIVQEADSIGPHLLSEMHGEGECFLVTKAGPKNSQPKPVGVLYLSDALKHAEGGSVKDAMKHDVEYIDEDKLLITALDEFLNRKQHFFVVANSFEELVGTLSLRQVLEQIFGPKPMPKAETDDKLASNDNQDSVEPTQS